MALILNEVVTQAEFGQLVGISQPRVSDLVSRGVLPADAPVGEWLLSYCEHLRGAAAGRAAAGDLDLAVERARLARAQAVWRETLNREKSGELAPAYLIEQVLSKAGARVASIFDAVPGTLRRRFPDLPAGVIELVASEIAKARNVAATVSLRDLEVESLADDEEQDE